MFYDSSIGQQLQNRAIINCLTVCVCARTKNNARPHNIEFVYIACKWPQKPDFLHGYKEQDKEWNNKLQLSLKYADSVHKYKQQSYKSIFSEL